MLKRLKRSLVESYVGAIALGYLLAEVILYFTYIFSSPVTAWLSQENYRRIRPETVPSPIFSFKYALPNLIAFVLLLVVWYILLRWL
jgi:hypothetical protein